MRRFAVRALAMLLLFTAIVGAGFAADDADPMKDVSPTALLRADQFDKLEAYYAHYLKDYNPKVVRSYAPLGNAIDGIVYSDELLPHFDKWIAARPNSFFAYLTRGNFMVGHAWAARGDDWGYRVSEESGRLMETRLLEADANLTKAAQINPSVPYPYYNLILVDMALGRGIAEASKHFVMARQIDPSYYPAYSAFMYSNTPRWGGNHEIMKTFAQNNADKVPGSLLPMLWIEYHEEMCHPVSEGNAWWSKPGNWEQFEGVIQKLIDQQTEKEKTWLRCRYVINASKAGKLDAVRQQLDLIGAYWYRGADPDDIYYYVHQAWTSINSYEWVIRHANAALEKDPKNASLYEMRGIAESENKLYDAAITDLSTAIKLDPNEIRPWRGIVSACLETSRTREAIAAADRYLRYKPGDEGTILLRGRALARMGQESAAVEFYKSKLQRYPGLTDIYWETCNILMKNRNFTETIKLVNQAQPYLDPKSNPKAVYQILLKRAQAKFELVNPEAVNEFGFLLTLENEEKDAEAALGRIYADSGKWAPYRDRAKELVDESLKGKSEEQRKVRMRAFTQNDSGNRLQHASSLEQSKRYAEAADVYKQLVADNPGSSEMLANMARNLYLAGKKEETLQCCLEFEKKFLNTATQGERDGMLNLHVWVQEQLKPGSLKQGFMIGAPQTPARNKSVEPATILSPEIRELNNQFKPFQATELAIRNVDANPESIEALSDLLAVTPWYHRQHIIDIAAKRNGPPPTAEQNRVFEANNARLLAMTESILQRAAKRKGAKDAASRVMTAQYMLFSTDKPDLPGVIKEVEEIKKLEGDSERAEEIMMYVHEKKGEFAESRRIAEELLKKTPGNSIVRIQILWLNRMQGVNK